MMDEIWCKAYRPTTESVLWLQIPDGIADECAEMDSVETAIDYVGDQTAWSFINSEKQLETLMESEV
jgi:hypothetical protein